MPKKSKSIANFGSLALLGFAVIFSPASESIASSDKFNKQMLTILEQYLIIPKALAADKTKGVLIAGGKIAQLASRLKVSTVTGKHTKHFKDIPSNIKAAAAKLIVAKDIQAMREALKELSKPMAMWASMTKPKGISVVYCSMAHGSWLQRGKVIANPYYGAKMLRCGEIVIGEGAGKKGQHEH